MHRLIYASLQIAGMLAGLGGKSLGSGVELGSVLTRASMPAKLKIEAALILLITLAGYGS